MSDADETIEVFVEIPRGSRNKYEFDHERHVLRLDRRLFTTTVYPADYGFLPDTLGEDGDPLDALVLLEEPTFPGCLVTARPVGVLWMTDEAGPDAKVLAVPPTEPRWSAVTDVAQVNPAVLAEIRHFFEIYKDLEPGKHAVTEDWGGADEAWQAITEARDRHRANT